VVGGQRIQILVRFYGAQLALAKSGRMGATPEFPGSLTMRAGADHPADRLEFRRTRLHSWFLYIAVSRYKVDGTSGHYDQRMEVSEAW